MALDTNLKGRTALITGASEGIGRATAKMLAAEGVHLHITARNEDRLKELKEELEVTSSVRVRCHPFDLTKNGDQSNVCKLAAQTDILINSAGSIPKGRIDEINETDWRSHWDLKVFSTINLCREFYAEMKMRGKGVILNVIGNGGEKQVSDYICGSSANAALMAFSRALGGDSPKDGIRVIGLNPGPVATEKLISMMKKAAADKWNDESRYNEFLAPFAFERAATVEELANMAVFLVSDLSSYTSGTIVTVDGGMVYKGPLF